MTTSNETRPAAALTKERVCDLITEAFMAGHLQHAEHELRLQCAHFATNSFTLAAVIDDLPENDTEGRTAR